MKLHRPSVPLEVRCRVVLRQLGEMFIDDVIRANRFVPRVVPARSLGRLLDTRLPKLAELLGCPLWELRLDHDPALENRKKVFNRAGDHVGYHPDANNPEFLLYRPHSAEFEGSHHIKTNIRGDHGQFPDNTLAKRERHRAKKLAGKKRRSRPIAQRKKPWPKRKFPRRAKR